MIAVAAFLSLWFTLKAAGRLRISIWIPAAMLLISPYFWLMQGSVLSHTSGLAMTALMTWAFIVWQQEGKLQFATIAGLAWAFLFLNRTYTSSWIALPFAIFVLIGLYRSPKLKLFVGTATFAACAAIGVAIFLVYNYQVSGDPFLSSYLYYDPADGPGFGSRHSVNYSVAHSLAAGWEALEFNLRTLNTRLWGFSGSLFVWGALVIIGWTHKYSLLFIASTFLVWGAYITFWFRGIPEVAPIYYYETLVFVVLSASLGVQRILDFNWLRSPLLRFGVISLTVLTVLTHAVETFQSTSKVITERNALKLTYQKVIHNVPQGAVVLLRSVPKDILDQATWNPHGMHSQPLILRDGWGVTDIIHSIFPDRPIYLVEGYTAQPARLLTKMSPRDYVFYANTLRSDTGRKGSNKSLIARAKVDKSGWLAHGRKQYLSAGRYILTFYIDAKLDEGFVGAVEAYKPSSKSSITSENVRQADRVISLEINLDEVTVIEPRVYYSGKGDLTFDRVEIRRKPDNPIKSEG